MKPHPVAHDGIDDHSDDDEPAGDEPPEATGCLPEEIKAAGWNAACIQGSDSKWYLPSGVTMIPGTGNSRRHEDSKSTFNYGKEVDTGLPGRKHATHENLMPTDPETRLELPIELNLASRKANRYATTKG